MVVQLYVHGVYWRTVWTRYGCPLCVPCDPRLVPDQFPLDPSHVPQRFYPVKFCPVRPLEGFLPNPKTGQAVWECTDPHVELIEGRLYFREVSS